jgi:hypothetical protein
MSHKRKFRRLKGELTALEVYLSLSPAQQRKAAGILRSVFMSRDITPVLFPIERQKRAPRK